MANGNAESQTRKSILRQPEVDMHINKFLNVICDSSRRSILELLVPTQEATVDMIERRSGDIAKEIGLSAATTSEHLQILLKAGLIASRREGNSVYYCARNHKLVQAFHTLIDALDQDYVDGHH
ncbi:MAG TPA: metalloregulator ArsR/SmtB family transcription factor [Ktedonobacteraceae bacterium]